MTSTKLFNKLMNDLPKYLEFEESKSGSIRAKFHGYTFFLYFTGHTELPEWFLNIP